MYNIDFQICAFIIVCMLMIIFFSKKMLRSFSDKVYMFLLEAIFASIIFDIVSTVIVITYPVYTGWVHNAFSKCYLVSLVIAMCLCYVFIAIDALGEKRKVYRILPLSLLPGYFGICYICLQNVSYSIVDGNLFFGGIAAGICYSICIFYLLAIIVLLQCGKSKMRKEIQQSARMVVILFLIIIVTEIVNATLRVESLALSLVAVYIYMNLKNADEHIDKALGIFNQNAFEYYLRDLGEDGKRASIIFIGFDDFKAMNTTFGFENGKKLFEDIVRALSDVYEGKVFRIDAYEIACVFSGGEPEYRNYRSTIRYKLREDFKILDASVKVPSYIVEIPSQESVFDYSELYAIMKKYMTNLVSSGQNYILIGEDHFKELRRQNNIRYVIEQAISEGYVDMSYQPIYNADTHQYDSAEALLRMCDGEGNFIPADLLIAIAEDTDLMLPLGRLIFKQVFSYVSKHNILGRHLQELHINLSGMQSTSEGLVEELSRQMSRYHIAPAYIDLEIRQRTEHANDTVLMSNMQSLLAFGSTFSLDDYGKGYANLESLMEWPIQYVKLDRELVHMEQPNEKAEQALFFVLEMARQLGMKVVAKGVESEDDFKRMLELHVNYMQGFYLAGVLDEKDFLDFLEKPLIMEEL